MKRKSTFFFPSNRSKRLLSNAPKSPPKGASLNRNSQPISSSSRNKILLHSCPKLPEGSGNVHGIAENRPGKRPAGPGKVKSWDCSHSLSNLVELSISTLMVLFWRHPPRPLLRSLSCFFAIATSIRVTRKVSSYTWICDQSSPILLLAGTAYHSL